jgi:hypothetical protein
MASKMKPFAERAAEKQRSREEDKHRLRRGEVSPAQLAAENSFFNLSLGVRILDFGRAPYRKYRKR